MKLNKTKQKNKKLKTRKNVDGYNSQHISTDFRISISGYSFPSFHRCIITLRLKLRFHRFNTVIIIIIILWSNMVGDLISTDTNVIGNGLN